MNGNYNMNPLLYNVNMQLGVDNFDAIVESSQSKYDLINILSMMDNKVHTNPAYVLPTTTNVINYILLASLDKANRILINDTDLIDFYQQVMMLNRNKLGYISKEVFQKVYEISNQRNSQEIFNNLDSNPAFQNFLKTNIKKQNNFFTPQPVQRIQPKSQIYQMPQLPQFDQNYENFMNNEQMQSIQEAPIILDLSTTQPAQQYNSQQYYTQNYMPQYNSQQMQYNTQGYCQNNNFQSMVNSQKQNHNNQDMPDVIIL